MYYIICILRCFSPLNLLCEFNFQTLKGLRKTFSSSTQSRVPKLLLGSSHLTFSILVFAPGVPSNVWTSWYSSGDSGSSIPNNIPNSLANGSQSCLDLRKYVAINGSQLRMRHQVLKSTLMGFPSSEAGLILRGIELSRFLASFGGRGTGQRERLGREKLRSIEWGKRNKRRKDFRFELQFGRMWKINCF